MQPLDDRPGGLQGTGEATHARPPLATWVTRAMPRRERRPRRP
jgi:hypothetical protein